MADGGGLENRYGVTPIVGSNPTPSARDLRFRGPWTVERVTGIEPAWPAWKVLALPGAAFAAGRVAAAHRRSRPYGRERRLAPGVGQPAGDEQGGCADR